MQWFEVDKNGLGKILERKGREFIFLELIQNALDENTRRVDVRFERPKNSKMVHFEVEDDSPTGFKDLTHAFTLFAESAKKSDPTKRGRFNAGEKLVLALCSEASIETTTGTVVFDDSGRRVLKAKRHSGSIFKGVIRMTDADLDSARQAIRSILIPQDVSLYMDGELLPSKKPLKTVKHQLPTEISDAEGRLKRTARIAEMEIYRAASGEGQIFEMGIPVVQSGDDYDVNIMQKVPLGLDRDNVTPSYMSKIRAVVLEAMVQELEQDAANSTWVKDAMQSNPDLISDQTVNRILDHRFGSKRVAYDPTDTEANKIAVSQGYTLVHGGSLSKSEWTMAKRTGTLLPAGQVTPSAKPYDPDGRAEELIPREKWTEGMLWVESLVDRLAAKLLKTPVIMRVINEPGAPFIGVYSKGRIGFNAGRLGSNWFAQSNRKKIIDLILHEFGHHYSSDHLSEDFYRALTDLGARAVELALKEPEAFI